MPYKYIKKEEEIPTPYAVKPQPHEPVITDAKLLTKEPVPIITEEESQQQYSDKKQKEFFLEDDGQDDEIIEVNWD